MKASLIAMVTDRLTDKVRQEAPWTMVFAEDIVICGLCWRNDRKNEELIKAYEIKNQVHKEGEEKG